LSRKIASPTFVLMKRFPLKSKNFSYLWHLDCYRLEHPQDLDILGFSDLLAAPEIHPGQEHPGGPDPGHHQQRHRMAVPG